ncbi:glycogen synthase [Hydrotalea sandarakina]|uniref:Glycogen synthase n=1 Tax=Hydrotalea sandarakina TaxID=1004304 RepID=A0A2W7RZT2_9BACT|nr:glycogen/starch synthase [Hydrotalea sandarakina]PZX66051.1 starch synthase [Hydrotalea sandarakina]
MEIIHVSAECYPMAKAGGLGDVVGALPKYQNKAGQIAKVVMPMHRTKFLYENKWDVDFKGYLHVAGQYYNFTIIKEATQKLGFDLYLVDINGLLDRDKIYGYDDDSYRYLAFQIAVLNWLSAWEHRPSIIHCHDHHSGLIPFMIKNCFDYRKLQSIPTILTIHNAQYQGWMGWDKSYWIPAYDNWKTGELDWNNTINPLASAIKCAWKVTTVSWSYLNELKYNSNGLEALFEYEKGKCVGILNGIDNDVWNPQTDIYLKTHYGIDDVTEGKAMNKQSLCKQFGLNEQVPLIIFIGRLVGEKAADILPETIKVILHGMKDAVAFLIVGSGDTAVEWQLSTMNNLYPGYYRAVIGYNEALSHEMYAGGDFLLMPSRVEPCGLNQMYAMRYGTVPMVRSTGGLQDTVIDMGDPDGFGIRFNHASIHDIYYSVSRAVEVYKDADHMLSMRKYMMQINHSWDKTVDEYTAVYQSVL